jgi:hypothetical protein
MEKFEIDITRIAYQGKVFIVDAETEQGAIHIALQKAFMETFEDYSYSEYKIIALNKIKKPVLKH